VAPNRILNISCGTGLLAIRLAELGHEVTGVDDAAAMLEMARQHDIASVVTWQPADAGSLRLGRRFDLAFMTGHVVQVLLDDHDLDRVLEAAQEHLSAQAWVHWTRRETQRTIETPVAGPVSVWHDTFSVEGEIIALETSHAFLRSGELTVTTSRLRFRHPGCPAAAAGRRRFRRHRRVRRLGRRTGDGDVA